MKSKFFRDAHELDSEYGRCEPGKVCVCLRIGKRAFEAALSRSQSLGLSSGEYVEALIIKDVGEEREPSGLPPPTDGAGG